MTNEPTPIQALEPSYGERLALILDAPTLPNTIFAHVANGGTLITLAEAWGVRHSDIAGFIAAHPTLKERYAFAKQERDEWEKERCLQELRAIMSVDIRDAYDVTGALKNVRDLPAALAAALSSVETDELFEGTGEARTQIGVTRKVKFWDKAKAIELFMKKHGLLIERVKVQHASTLEEILTASQAQVIDAEPLPPQQTEVKSVEAGGDTGV